VIEFALTVSLSTLVAGIALTLALRLLPTVRLQLAGLALLAVGLPLAAVILGGLVMFHMHDDVKILAVAAASASTALAAALLLGAEIARRIRGLEAAAEELEVNVADLETDGRGNIHVKGAPHRSISTKDVAIAAQFRQGRTISGRGIFLVPLSDVDPETGEMSPATCYAHACLVAEVEVDDETGEVAMVRMDSAYELGRALNPRLVEQQLVGGAWMGISHALYETPEPYYPDPSHGPRDFVEYLMPGPGDICPHDISVLERPAPDGPFGAKGPGEMCANPVMPAIANAIFNAVGVRMDELPITPEKVLRAIKAQGGARPQARR